MTPVFETTHKTRRGQAGFSLLELMISLGIASFILLAMYQNFMVTSRTNQLLDGFATLQENARYASDVIVRSVRNAGVKAQLGFTTLQNFPADAAPAAFSGVTFVAGQVVSGVNNNAFGLPILPGSDIITFRLQGNQSGTSTDCLGRNVPAGVTAKNTLYVTVDPLTNINSLMCSSTIPGVANLSYPIAEGVEDMQVLYGIDNTGVMTADTYNNAAAMTPALWTSVVSVRIAVLFNTVAEVAGKSGQMANTRSYTMLDNGLSNFSDGLRRQLFVTTINFRNMSF